MTTPTSREELHRPFRSRRGRRVAIVVGAAHLALMIVIAVSVAGMSAGERIATVGVGAAVAAGLWRLASVSAVPDADGLRVRNLAVTVYLAWPQIVAVRFGGGNPWAVLDIDSGATVPVMAIQRADGAWAQTQARRLATLVAVHSRTARDD